MRTVASVAVGCLAIVCAGASAISAGPPSVVVSGSVYVGAAGDQVALPSVLVALSDGDSFQRSVTTSDGTFQFIGVPSGYYSIVAAARGTMRSELGAFRPGEAGTRLAVHDRPISGLAIRLEKAPSLAGTVLEGGRAVAGTAVTARRSEDLSARTAMTDGNGRYQFDELLPGTYRVSVFESRLRGMPPPVYHVGSRDPSRAAAVSVGAGESLDGIDISIPTEATATIGGIVMGVGGAGVPRALVTASHEFAVITQSLTGPDGRFSLRDIPAGTITVTAGETEPFRGPATAKAMLDSRLVAWGEAQVIASPGSQPEAQIHLRSASTALGEVRLTGGALGSVPAVLVSLLPKRSIVQPVSGAVTGGRFKIGGLIPGDYGISIRAEDPGWVLTRVESPAVRVGMDVRISDAPIHEFILHIERVTAGISGFLRDGAGTKNSGYWVVLFPTDRSLVYAGSPYVRKLRPATDGKYELKGLPAGNYLLAVGRDHPTAASDLIGFIGAIQDSAVPISIGPGEIKIQDLVIR